MKKILLSWILPVLIAIIMVIVAKASLFTSYIILDNSMFPLFKKGDKVVCFEKKAKKRNKIVFFVDKFDNKSISVKRQIAIPGDTLAIKGGTVVVNGQKVTGIKSITHEFSFLADSIALMSKYLADNYINTDFRRVSLGYFDCNLSEEKVNELKSVIPISNLRKKSLEPNVLLSKDNFGSDFYWNHDNLGSLIVPRKGMKIKLGKRSFYLYKKIIWDESGIEPIKNGSDVFIGNEKMEVYTFKNDYVFLANDNRSNYNDSRSYGFIAKNQIIGTYLLKLPW